MKTKGKPNRVSEGGSALICALTTILILSLVGAGVLMNCNTRYNASSTQVKGWKEALNAAEAGGEMGFRVLRERIGDPPAAFNAATGWVSPAPAPLSGSNSWALGFDDASPLLFGPENRLQARVTVDRFQLLPGSPDVGYYRIRSIGTAQVTGLKRVGMDNRMNIITEGDNLLRKIDFNFRHFKAAYGHGDALPTAPETAANGKGITKVANLSKPEVSRRIELIATPIMPIEGAVKTAGRLRASKATFDSYDSKNGTYKGTNPPSPYDVDAHDADAVCGSSDFDAGMIYGDIATNGGAAKTSQSTGVVDNNVPSMMPLGIPGNPALPPSFPEPTPSGSTISPSATPYPAGHASGKSGQYPTEFWYSYPTVTNLTIEPLKVTVGGVPNTPIDTTVNIYVTGDVAIANNGAKLTIAKGVTAKIYFRGNMTGKAEDFDNQNVDGPGGHGVYAPNFIDRGINPATGAAYEPRYTLGRIAPGAGRTSGSKTVTSATPVFSAEDVGKSIEGTGIPPAATIASVTSATSVVISVNATATTTAGDVTVGAYSPSTLVSRANHLWFYGIPPADGSSRTIDIAPPGKDGFYAGFYAPGHDFTTRGNPDFYGCFIVKSFYTNGNNTFHYDKQLAAGTDPLDYRLSSYIEDIR